MICEKCGKETEFLEVDMFEYDGSDDWYMADTYEEGDCVMLNLLPQWTGYELDEDEYHETIRCPHCKKYPFKDKLIEATRMVCVQMWAERKEE